ncbi:MAG: DNA polymerase Y family protein, partial [Nocardioides sp.]
SRAEPGVGPVRRVMVLWCPDWPVATALAEADREHRLPAVVLSGHLVIATNQVARSWGIRRGMRRRDAQSRCPQVLTFDADPDRDARAFELVARSIEEFRPGVALLRPGLLAVRSPGRFYGGEREAAALLAEHLAATLTRIGIENCRIGVADDVFTAEQAARQALPQDCVVVPPAGAAGFLAGLSVDCLDDPELAGLLRRLGVRSLGDFAGLPKAEVSARFGDHGARLHRCARGQGNALLGVREPPPELTCEMSFEPPVDSAEVICFSARRHCEHFVEQLSDRALVCTRLRIDVESGAGVVASSQTWMHGSGLGSEDVVDRLRWQLSGELRGADIGQPVTLVRLVPELTESSSVHADGLWGGAVDARVRRGVAKIQGLIGHDAVLRGVPQGGRAPHERQALVPWGEPADGLRSTEQPWPGSLPAPAPTRVFADPRPALVVGDGGRPVGVTARGEVTASPALITPEPGAASVPVAAWAGPWPVEGSWWAEGPRPPRLARFQIVGVDGSAWLMRCESGRWWTEAEYD